MSKRARQHHGADHLLPRGRQGDRRRHAHARCHRTRCSSCRRRRPTFSTSASCRPATGATWPRSSCRSSTTPATDGATTRPSSSSRWISSRNGRCCCATPSVARSGTRRWLPIRVAATRPRRGSTKTGDQAVLINVKGVPKLEINILSNLVDFARTPVVRVTLSYGEQRQTVSFTSAGTSAVQFPVAADGRRDYAYEITWSTPNGDASSGVATQRRHGAVHSAGAAPDGREARGHRARLRGGFCGNALRRRGAAVEGRQSRGAQDHHAHARSSRTPPGPSTSATAPNASTTTRSRTTSPTARAIAGAQGETGRPGGLRDALSTLVRVA